MPKIVLAHGCFDGGVHPGHMEHFKNARNLGDRLIVSVTSDKYVNKGPGRPIFPQELRMHLISELRCVDAVILSDSHNGVESIMQIRPAIFAKGPDYAKYDPTGNLDLERNAVEAIGGRLSIIENTIKYSSTEIITGELLQKRINQWIKECKKS